MLVSRLLCHHPCSCVISRGHHEIGGGHHSGGMVGSMVGLVWWWPLCVVVVVVTVWLFLVVIVVSAGREGWCSILFTYLCGCHACCSGGVVRCRTRRWRVESDTCQLLMTCHKILEQNLFQVHQPLMCHSSSRHLHLWHVTAVPTNT